MKVVDLFKIEDMERKYMKRFTSLILSIHFLITNSF